MLSGSTDRQALHVQGLHLRDRQLVTRQTPPSFLTFHVGKWTCFGREELAPARVCTIELTESEFNVSTISRKLTENLSVVDNTNQAIQYAPFSNLGAMIADEPATRSKKLVLNLCIVDKLCI